MVRRSTGGFVALVVACGLIASLLTPPAGAASNDKKQRQQQIGTQIDTLRGQVDEASAEEEALLGQIDTARAKLAGLDAQVHDLDGQVNVAQKALARAQNRLTQQEQALEAASDRLDAVSERLDSAEAELKRRAVDAYVGHDGTDVSEVLLNLKTSHEIAAAEGYASVAIGSQQGTVDRYDQLREDADAAAKLVAAARDEAQSQRDAVAAQRSAVQAQRDRLAGVRQQAANETSHESQLLNEVQSRKSEFEGQIASLQAESNQITDFLRTLSSSGGIVVSGKGIFSMPIAGAPITSGFGSRVHPIFHTVRVHTGLDFGASEGTPIRAGADGTVVKAGPLGGYGNATVIDHGRGLATLYGHQSRILVHEGQQVKRGEIIGLVGHTGFATGPHLHFEVRVDGTPVNPVSYL